MLKITTLEVSPDQIKGSFDIQTALKQVDGINYDAIHFNAGNYLIDDSQSAGQYAFFQINSGTKLYGDIDEDGNVLTIFKLMDNAPVAKNINGKSVNYFSCGMPIFGTAEVNGHDIEIFNICFDGNSKPSCTNQVPFTKTTCPGTNNGNRPYGKGFSNFIGTIASSFTNCSFHDIQIINSSGDGLRVYRAKQSSGLKIYNWDIIRAGHAGILLENTINSCIKNIKVVTRANGAVRLQNGCSNVLIDNVESVGTSLNYGPLMQITGNDITIQNCRFDNGMFVGLEFIGLDNTNLLVKNCEFNNCGWGSVSSTGGAYNPGATAINYGTAGLLLYGVSGTIQNCSFNRCFQNSIATNFYSPDGAKAPYKGKNFVIEIIDCEIIDTQKTSFSGILGDGKDIANLLPGHTVKCRGTSFNPWNHTNGVIFED